MLVRLVKGGVSSVVEMEEAQRLADEAELDLVIIANSDMPVYKIVDINKYNYEQAKKQKELEKAARKNRQELKEVWISPNIDQHDLEVKAATVDRLLQSNNKVQIGIKFKGREMRFIGTGVHHLSQVESIMKSKYKVVFPAKISGNSVTMCIAPVK